MNPPKPNTSALTSMLPGQTAVVRETRMDARDAALLRAMGLRPNATVRLCRLGEPCIVEVLTGSNEGGCNGPAGCWCRIGLARPLANAVVVEDPPAAPGPAPDHKA